VNIIEKADHLLENVAPPRHTLFQLQFFVVGKEPTLQAKMHRCLEELKSRRNMVQAASLEIEETNDVNALHEIEIHKLGSSAFIDEEEREIKIRQIKRKISANNTHSEELKAKILAWKEEMDFFIECFEMLSKQEPIRPWDDYHVQLEYWNEKTLQEIKRCVLLKKPVDMEQIRLILSLPDEAPVKKQMLEIMVKSLSNDK